MKIMPITQCKAVTSCMSSPQSYVSGYDYGKPKATAVAARALQALAKAFEADKATHEANLPAIENNKAIAERVNALMQEIGMPPTFTQRDPHSRARIPKSVRHDAGYLTDLRREVQTNDNWEHAEATHQRLLRDYTAYEARAAEEDAKARALVEREREREIEQRKADIKLAAILLRYDLSLESSWDDVLEALSGKHQRLDLAVAMRLTRGDWSEGPYRVRDALDRFKIATDEDKAIANDIIDCLRDFEDGRVFRDTAWSYDVLFASVGDRQLVADVQLAMENTQ
ncbi:hypothetical protein AB8813_08880 [Xanthomonas arboricola pv. corylina]|uniref:hypothetical protein n=1 Tax=Xanthomonas arboricola TaxID=56448 RepID=UPI000CEDB5CD|nr:hypothetical protein [Xanthomonas arboricola]PPU60001.1 hypothetical protein XacyCFBP1159_13150 [Xanthomonas arboricola pv. corylina]